MHFAAKSLERGRQAAFLGLWSLTVILGGAFSIRHGAGVAPADL